MTTDIDNQQERERFEACFRNHHFDGYAHGIAWDAWQARAALDTGTALVGWGLMPAEWVSSVIAAPHISIGAMHDTACACHERGVSSGFGKVGPVACIACEGSPQAPNDPCAVCGKSSRTPFLYVDALAQEIRRVDGNHNLGAGALAEALMPFLSAHAAHPDAREAAEEMREACAIAVRDWINRPNDCEELVGVDPGTGARRCALEARGRDCIFSAQVEAAEEILRRIRALQLPGDKKGEHGEVSSTP
ncbi:hypothetical protein [Xanthobacter agilis]|uniref:Uncharacterized protein n=1 Tax=Xanthobacter agilis TaxID=47492 RepID=A0ABU0LFT0_XANAG|nr:hypothetical protein [Xanthobacter agilis]MDQ0506004.1 hypothetical protein [Xanthobacter agilis]